MTTYTSHTSWQLAKLADCSDPDRHDGIGFEDEPSVIAEAHASSGAIFLRRVERDVIEALEDNGGQWDEDRAHEIADGAVPIYTHEMWQTFTDLGAYNEDPSELGAESDDMTRAAGVCLYMVADRLAHALAETYTEQAEDEND